MNGLKFDNANHATTNTTAVAAAHGRERPNATLPVSGDARTIVYSSECSAAAVRRKICIVLGRAQQIKK
jgi:hypothetical protein